MSVRTALIVATFLMCGCAADRLPSVPPGADAGGDVLFDTPQEDVEAADSTQVDADTTDVGGDLPLIPDNVVVVALDGDDANPGSEASPVRTLARARDRVREIRAGRPRSDVHVLLRQGTYLLEETLVLGVDDGGGLDNTITYASYPGESATLSGSVPVHGWVRVQDRPADMPEDAVGDLWRVDVSNIRALKEQSNPNQQWQFNTLYRGGYNLPRARGRGFAPRSATLDEVPSRSTILVPAGAVGAWADLGHAEVMVIPSVPRSLTFLPILDLDTDRGLLLLDAPATSIVDRNVFSEHGEPSVWVENTLGVLDTAGEWVLDPDTATLWLLTASGETPSGIEAPILSELVRVEGLSDDSEPTDTPVTGLAFEDLTFTHGDRVPHVGDTGWGLHNDWEVFDAPTALLRFRGAATCRVSGCTFVDSGHTGLRADLTASHLTIEGNLFARLGGVGVLLAGYGVGTKDVNRDNTLIDNTIHHVGRLLGGSPGILIWQSGHNLVSQNTLHHLSDHGIVVSSNAEGATANMDLSYTTRVGEILDAVGSTLPTDWADLEPFLHARDNVIERNDISGLEATLQGGDCIYISSAGGDNAIRDNFCHDSFGRRLSAGVRAGDWQHDTTIEGNVVFRTGGSGVGLVSKGDNDLIGNYLVDLRQDARGGGQIRLVRGPDERVGGQVRDNVLTSPVATGPPVVVTTYDDSLPAPSFTDYDLDHNLFFAEDGPWVEDYLTERRADGLELASREAAPRFENVNQGDLRVQAGSAILDMGLEPPIDLDLVGVQPPWRGHFGADLAAPVIVPRSKAVAHTVHPFIVSRGVDVRYTLDGTEPNLDDPVATDLDIWPPVTLRVRAFSDDGTDWQGASQTYWLAPPWLLREHFDYEIVGSRPSRGTVDIDSDQYAATISADRSHSGEHCLKITDGPGQQRPFTPVLRYDDDYGSGHFTAHFSLWIDAATAVIEDWRDYASPACDSYCSAGWLKVAAGGTVLVRQADDQGVQQEVTVGTLPLERWVNVTIECAFNVQPAACTLSVDSDGTVWSEESLWVDPDFATLTQFGFASYATEEATFYLDDVELEAR